MHQTCTVCSLKFQREQGYFLGAMYFNYILSLLTLAVFIIILSLSIFSDWPTYVSAIAATVIYLPLIPLIFRYSRILWIHIDRFIDPGEMKQSI